MLANRLLRSLPRRLTATRAALTLTARPRATVRLVASQVSPLRRGFWASAAQHAKQSPPSAGASESEPPAPPRYPGGSSIPPGLSGVAAGGGIILPGAAVYANPTPAAAAAAAAATTSDGTIDPLFPNTGHHHLMKTNIEGYGGGVFQINGMVFRGSVLVLPNCALLWSPTTWEEVTPDHLALLPLIVPKIDLLIIGGGKWSSHPTPATAAFLKRHGIGYEPMNTLNACATFSLLNAEDRRVAACIIANHDVPEAEPISEERIHQMKVREKRLRGL